ncbi:MAG: PDDEXK nuclease domain-containing protein [Blastocatellia bacterium]|nr:PDDEXK nuclease domain-containing protein [Blastocatellia bacterium]
MTAKKNILKTKTALATVRKETLLAELRELILATRSQVAQIVNAGLTALYWQIGDRVRREILKEKRAEYGAEIVSALGRQLEVDFGRGFSEKSLRHMLRFAEAFPDFEIVSALMRQLSWTHFKSLMYLDDSLKRGFYTEMCRIERWSTRTLQDRIQSMLYERTAISKKPEKLIQQELKALREEDALTPDLVFRDPYFLDFLGLKDTYSEKDLESAILREMEAFLLELGGGFAFVARQKRITLDGDDYYIDLLFYHRLLRRLVLIELKIGDFKPADKGQAELYLRWLDRHERQAGEDSPIALILCAGKKRETVEYLNLSASGIHIAEYLTALPPRELLAERLHAAVLRARLRLAQTADAAKDIPAAPPAKRKPKGGVR